MVLTGNGAEVRGAGRTGSPTGSARADRDSSSATAAAVTGIAYPVVGLACSTVQPALAEPAAMPPSIAVTASVIPSLRLPAGVSRWTSVMPVTMVGAVGAVAAPASSRATASRAAEPVRAANSGSVISAVMAARQTASRPANPRAVGTVPYSRPAAHDPAAWGPSSRPADGPSSSASVLTSSAPKTAPVARKTVSSPSMPGARSGERDPAGRPAGGGSVERWGGEDEDAGHHQDRADQRARFREQRRAQQRGEHRAEHEAQLVGGLLKEFALCSAAGSPWWRWAQRARDMPPVLGVVAVAAVSPSRSSCMTRSSLGRDAFAPLALSTWMLSRSTPARSRASI